MRKVADNSFLQDQEALRRYLSSSKRNCVVLTDYSAMEAYKTGRIDSTYKYTRILQEYPQQALVLKGTHAVSRLRGRQAGMQRRMIDEEQSAGLLSFYRQIEALAQDGRKTTPEFSEHVDAAKSQMERVLGHAEGIPDAFDRISEMFSQDELRVIRTGSQYTREIVRKVMGFVVEMSNSLHGRPALSAYKVRPGELHNTYIYRAVLCNAVLMIYWLSKGGATGVRPEKIRNDMIDCYMVAYATYFDGILTNDDKQKYIYEMVSPIVGIPVN